jgi:membrane protease YdiL (CAAX protease family)
MYRKKFELKRPFPWKVYLLILLATLLTNIAVQPYQLAIQGMTYDPSDLPSLLQSIGLNTIIYGAFAAIGLYLATRIGLGLPYLERLFPKGKVWGNFRRVLLISIITGVVVVILIIGVDQLIFNPMVVKDLTAQGMEPTAQESIRPEWWQSLLASFYGGITEEIQLRLFLLTLVAWLVSRVWREDDGRPGLGALWTATLISSIIFGLGHLPTLNASLSAMGLSLSPILIASNLVMNGIGGIVFGVLFWSLGLESAMIAHFMGDIVLHLILPIILG